MKFTMSNLIKNTTKEERSKLVKRALAISNADGSVPSDKAIELAKKYINGEMELEQVKDELIKQYKKV